MRPAECRRVWRPGLARPGFPESGFRVALNVLHHALIGQFVVRPGDGEYGDAQLLGEFSQGRQGLARLQLAAEYRRTDLGFDLLVDGLTGHG